MKQKQKEMDQDKFLDKEFRKSTKLKDSKKRWTVIKTDALKYARLVQIAFLVLATVLLIDQDFLYAQVLGVGVGVVTAEKIWKLVFRGV